MFAQTDGRGDSYTYPQTLFVAGIMIRQLVIWAIYLGQIKAQTASSISCKIQIHIKLS